ncbi:hypothetical protein EVAR_80290_1 [Eumeta japonica]|uniref:PiggyBac transposable element-derived protein domain-containing protein n=1 Tax=Eumeta variegata TaxID=151549 RepID=A0A4C1UB44_EUMVA|nr:hypothetical protein EVAR_80290_1 [Eumeta japonica]
MPKNLKKNTLQQRRLKRFAVLKIGDVKKPIARSEGNLKYYLPSVNFMMSLTQLMLLSTMVVVTVPLAKSLHEEPYKLTLVGTIRSNKREIPEELKNTRSRPIGTSMFYYDRYVTLVSYKPKPSKMVYLLSSSDEEGILNPTTEGILPKIHRDLKGTDTARGLPTAPKMQLLIALRYYATGDTQMDLRSQNEKILQWLEESDTESIPENQSQSDSEEDNNNLETEIHFETDESDEDVAVSSEDDVFVPRTGRSRRLVIDSDSDDGTPTTFGSNQIVDVNNEHTQHQQSVIQPRQNILYGKNQHKWSTIPRDPRTRTGARNVLHIVPRPVGISKELSKPKNLFHLFIPEEIIGIIVQYSNIEINIKNNKYKTSKYTTTQTSANEIKALLGLLIQSAALKSNHLPTRTLFDTLRSAKTYKAA